MLETKYELKSLTDALMKEVVAYGILEVSLGQYQAACNRIVQFTVSSG